MENTYTKEILARVKEAPASPGCYLYSDQYGNIIYVGKAKSLKKRVASYFTAAATKDERLEELLPKIASIEYRVTDSELDALILEYQLIKQHKPWFNSAMKADKRRPFLRIGRETPYPTLSIAQERAEDEAEYYDIFTDGDDIKLFLAVFGRVWGTAQCGKVKLPAKASPCLYHSLGQCLAPCAGKADESQYEAAVDEIRALLQNRSIPKLAELKKDMETAAADLEFEKASECKRQLEQLERLRRKARRMYHYPEGANVLVLIRPFRESALSLFAIRDDAVMGRQEAGAETSMEELEQFAAYWGTAGTAETGDAQLAKCLTEISADRVFVRMPKKLSGQRIMQEIEKFEKAGRKRG